jgi:hypothetical protein
MATANVSSDSSDGARANEARVHPTGTGHCPAGAITASGCCEAVYEGRRDLLLDRSEIGAPQGLDQARLGEEPQPMLPGLEGC